MVQELLKNICEMVGGAHRRQECCVEIVYLFFELTRESVCMYVCMYVCIYLSMYIHLKNEMAKKIEKLLYTYNKNVAIIVVVVAV